VSLGEELKCQGKEIVTQINRWYIRTASVLAVTVLCSCASTYTPDQSSVQAMSVEEARKVVLQRTKSPVLFFDLNEGSVQQRAYEISKVDVRTTSMNVTVIRGKRYFIPLNDLDPSLKRSNVASPDAFAEVYLNERQGFSFRASQGIVTIMQGSGDTDFPTLGNHHFFDRLVDALSVLKSASIKFTEDDEARFQEAARNYRASAVKPQLSEDARRFAVQAEGSIRDKDFDAAADYYQQALEVAPWWPQGHYDRAMVFATGLDDYPDAIIEMKRYLTLVPEAPNARALQDKIYDWERKASTAN